MARYNKVTFSNSQAAATQTATVDDSELWQTQYFDVLDGDPTSATIYSIGTTGTTMTVLSGAVSVPSDLLAAYSSDMAYYSLLGAQITVSGSQVGYNMSTMSDAEKLAIDNLAVGSAPIEDQFYYAIQMAGGTVSWNTVTVSIFGVAANLAVYQEAGFVVEAANWGVSPPANDTDALADGGAVTAFAASGDLTTITVAADSANHGTLTVDAAAIYDSDIGALAYHFTYSVAEELVYDTHKGYGEKAFTDSWTVTTANGTMQTFSEDVYGNIHAPIVTEAAATVSSIVEGGSVGLNIAATDHDDNASLIYTISGVPTNATLSYTGGALSGNPDGSYTLTDAQLRGLNVAPAPSFTGNIDLTVTATNTEGPATAQTEAHIAIEVTPPNNAPVITACPENVTSATLSTVPGHIIVGDYLYVPGRGHAIAYDGANFLQFDGPDPIDTRATGVNAAGQIVGGYTDGHSYYGFFYQNGELQTLIDPAATGLTYAQGINDAGQITGEFDDATGEHGFLYSQGTYRTLDFPSATIIATQPGGINDKGQIVGTYQDATGWHGFIATPMGCGYTWSSFDWPGHDGQTAGVGINNLGQVVGAVRDPPGPPGFAYDGTTFTTIAPPFGYYDTFAYGIDDQGEVVGAYYTSGYHGYLYNSDGFQTIDDPLGETVFNDIHDQAATGYGRFAFSDGDLGDTHSVSAALTSAVWSGGAVPDDLATALASALTPTIVQDTTGGAAGEVDWRFSFPDAFKGMLGDGDKFNASYGVTVTDNHGASTTQNVDLTIIGASDWFHIIAS